MSGLGETSDDRPVALVTASCRGPGLDALRQICEVVYDPWIDQHPLRIWDGAKLAERVDEVGATVLVCEADFVAGEVLDRPLRVIGSTRGDPTNVDVAAATAKGIPVLRTPGRNADGVAELTVALLMAVTRHLLPGDRDVALERDLRQRLDPLPALPRLADRRPHRRSRRSGRGRSGRALAPRRARHERHRLRSLLGRRHPRLARSHVGRGRRRVDARGTDARDPGHDGRRPVRGDAPTAPST